MLRVPKTCNWMQRANFLAYAIANGWGTKAGCAYSKNTLDAVAKEWRLGGGRCPEVLMLLTVPLFHKKWCCCCYTDTRAIPKVSSLVR